MGSSTTLSVGIVAPFWLYEPLSVLVQAAPGATLAACTTCVETLLSQMVEEPPDLVLLYASGRHISSRIRRIKAAWPSTRCIVLVEDAQLYEIAQQTGADLVLREGFVPRQLIKAINSFARRSGQSQSEDEAS